MSRQTPLSSSFGFSLPWTQCPGTTGAAMTLQTMRAWLCSALMTLSMGSVTCRAPNGAGAAQVHAAHLPLWWPRCYHGASVRSEILPTRHGHTACCSASRCRVRVRRCALLLHVHGLMSDHCTAAGLEHTRAVCLLGLANLSDRTRQGCTCCSKFDIICHLVTLSMTISPVGSAFLQRVLWHTSTLCVRTRGRCSLSTQQCSLGVFWELASLVCATSCLCCTGIGMPQPALRLKLSTQAILLSTRMIQ